VTHTQGCGAASGAACQAAMCVAREGCARAPGARGVCTPPPPPPATATSPRLEAHTRHTHQVKDVGVVVEQRAGVDVRAKARAALRVERLVEVCLARVKAAAAQHDAPARAGAGVWRLGCARRRACVAGAHGCVHLRSRSHTARCYTRHVSPATMTPSNMIAWCHTTHNPHTHVNTHTYAHTHLGGSARSSAHCTFVRRMRMAGRMVFLSSSIAVRPRPACFVCKWVVGCDVCRGVKLMAWQPHGLCVASGVVW
jgi:hypothetical protein